MGFQSHLSLQPHSHVCQDQLSSYGGLQIANVDGQKHSTHTRSRCSYVARVHTADPRSQLKGSSCTRTSRLAPGRAETSLQCSFSATLVWMIQWGVEGVENPDTSLVRRLQHHCHYEYQYKGGEQGQHQKNNREWGRSVEKPDTSLARQFKHQGKSSSVKRRKAQEAKRKGKEQRGWKGVCTKDRGEEEAGSPDQSSIRTARHRGGN